MQGIFNAQFNQQVQCKKHNKQCTMTCLTEKCEDRILCQECVINHPTSHISQIIPFQEFNRQTNMVPQLIGREIDLQRQRLYKLQTNLVTTKESRKQELRFLLKKLKDLVLEQYSYFEQECVKTIELHFEQFTKIISEQLYSMQNHLDQIKPFVSEVPKEVYSSQIQTLIKYQEQMINQVIPQMEIQVNNVIAQAQQTDIYINKDSFLASSLKNLSQTLSVNEVFNYNDPTQNYYKKLRQQRNSKMFLNNSEIIENSSLNNSLHLQQNNSQINSIPFEKHFEQINQGIIHSNIVLQGHTDIVTFILIIDQNRIASASGDYSIKIWDIKKSKCIGNLKSHVKDVWGLCMISGTRFMGSCSSDQSIKLWDIDDFQCIGTLLGHKDVVKSLVYFQQNNVLISGSFDSTLKIWSVKEKSLLTTLGQHDGYVKTLFLNENAGILFSGGQDKVIKVWDLDKRYVVQTLSGHQSEINIICQIKQKQGSILIAAGTLDGFIYLWNALEGVLIKKFSAHKSSVNGIVFSSLNNVLITASSDKTVKYWNADSLLLVESLLYHKDVIQHLNFHESYNLVITASWDQTIQVRKIDIKNIQTDPVQYLKTKFN